MAKRKALDDPKQAAAFRKAARERCDESEERFKEALRRLQSRSRHPKNARVSALQIVAIRCPANYAPGSRLPIGLVLLLFHALVPHSVPGGTARNSLPNGMLLEGARHDGPRFCIGLDRTAERSPDPQRPSHAEAEVPCDIGRGESRT